MQDRGKGKASWTEATVRRAAAAIIVVICSLATSGLSQAQILRPIGAVGASTQRGTMYNPNNLTSAPLAAAPVVVLHAGAIAAPGAPAVATVPGGQPAGLPTIPVQYQLGRINTPGSSFTGPVLGRRRPYFPYVTTPKVFGAPMTAGPVTSTQPVVGNAATATATATFTLAPARVRNGVMIPLYNSVNTSTASLIRVGLPRPTIWGAGAIVLDPISFNATNGLVLDSQLSLNPGLSAMPDPSDPDKVSGFFWEGGANIPGLSPNAVGMSNDGVPLFYDLSLTFDGALPPMISLTDDRTVGNFYVPGTNTVMSDADIINALEGDLSFNGSLGWTLNTPLDLFEYATNPISGLPAAGEVITMDMNSGVGVADVPEPAPWVYILALPAAFAVWRVRRRAALPRP